MLIPDVLLGQAQVTPPGVPRAIKPLTDAGRTG